MEILCFFVMGFCVGAIFEIYISKPKQEITFFDTVKGKKPRNHVPENTQFIRAVSDEWDITLNDMLDKGELISISEHVLKIKYKNRKLNVWIANFPYGFGRLHDFMTMENPVPKPETMTRLKNLIDDIRDGKIPGIRTKEDMKFIEMRR